MKTKALSRKDRRMYLTLNITLQMSQRRKSMSAARDFQIVLTKLKRVSFERGIKCFATDLPLEDLLDLINEQPNGVDVFKGRRPKGWRP